MGPQSSYVRRLAIVAWTAGVLSSCGGSEAPDDETQPVRAPEIARVVSAEEALTGAHVPTLDPATMNYAEIQKVLGLGPFCEFRYTSSGKPVLAMATLPNGAATNGVVKLNGSLVAIQPAATGGTNAPTKELVMIAGTVRTTITPVAAEQAGDRGGERHREANLVFEVDGNLRVGYRGYYNCLEKPPSATPR